MSTSWGAAVGTGLAGLLLAGAGAGAQTTRDTTAAGVADSAAARRLPTVRVQVTRESSRSPLELPFAVTSVRPDSARPGQRHLSLDEQLQLLPGVTVANRSNPSQDPRISIRGFGSRSAFGVRGVRVLRDGMPLTLPDGQTPVDYMDLESVGRIEVIRGAASALYGNASGGVIDVRTVEPPAGRVAAQLRGVLQNTSNDDGGRDVRRFGRWSAVVGGRAAGERLRYQANVAHNDGEGYRDYARQRLTSGFGRAVVRTAGTDVALTALLLDMPLAENPGALTYPEMAGDRRRADPLSVARRARKEVTQGQVGLSASRPVRGGDVFALAYGGWRSLYNPLTFNVVDVGRSTAGASLRGSAVPVPLFGVTHRLSAGVDYQRQDDDRKNFNACNGRTAAPPAGCTVPVTSERGAVTLDQRELIQSVGPFVRDELRLGDRVSLSVGGRADVIKFRVEDHLVAGTNPDDSGDRTMRAFSPAVGVVTRLSLLHALYANVSSAFETPTTTELGNQENGDAGINRDLKPQYSTTYEIGMKGLVLNRVQYDIAGFVTPVRDELIQFTAASSRSYFRNAGRTRRRGFESAL
ncbi:MAG TPA: TonB-dependent receptor, partial [Gemmatimonadaceae bacterium]|nr:TonB-dependent receptor [Gemmatimonadaceae bacterium]